VQLKSCRVQRFTEALKSNFICPINLCDALLLSRTGLQADRDLCRTTAASRPVQQIRPLHNREAARLSLVNQPVRKWITPIRESIRIAVPDRHSALMFGHQDKCWRSEWRICLQRGTNRAGERRLPGTDLTDKEESIAWLE
jgi:hypothetical protein